MQDSVEVGKNMMKDFSESLPHGFYNTVSQRTVFCGQKRRSKVNETPVIHQDVMFSRAMILISTGDLPIDKTFASELAVNSPSLFHENGDW